MAGDDSDGGEKQTALFNITGYIHTGVHWLALAWVIELDVYLRACEDEMAFPGHART